MIKIELNCLRKLCCRVEIFLAKKLVQDARVPASVGVLTGPWYVPCSWKKFTGGNWATGQGPTGPGYPCSGKANFWLPIDFFLMSLNSYDFFDVYNCVRHDY